jgi:hypothetical protein
MKIAYLISSDIAHFRGSTLKIKGQVECWEKMGHSVKVFCYSPNLDPSPLEAKRYLKKNPIIDKFVKNKLFVKDIESFDPNIIYIRYSLPTVDYKILQKKYPSVIEINTDDTVEYKSLYFERGGMKNLFLWILNNLLRKNFLRRASGLVAVSREIGVRQSITKFNKHIKVIPNGINIPAAPEKMIDIKDGPIKLFFIGSPGLNWHGVDRLEVLAYKLIDIIEIHIIGMKGENKKNVNYHGYLSQNEYRNILKECHICIGTLALYKKKMTEACPLKVREYISNGYPIIIAYKDTAFLEKKPPWVLELPNVPDLFDDEETVRRVMSFSKEYRDYIVSREEAEFFIGIEQTESKRLAFLSDVSR